MGAWFGDARVSLRCELVPTVSHSCASGNDGCHSNRTDVTRRVKIGDRCETFMNADACPSPARVRRQVTMVEGVFRGRICLYDVGDANHSSPDRIRDDVCTMDAGCLWLVSVDQICAAPQRRIRWWEYPCIPLVLPLIPVFIPSPTGWEQTRIELLEYGMFVSIICSVGALFLLPFASLKAKWWPFAGSAINLCVAAMFVVSLAD
jgi:hypothetical protein